MLDWKAAHVGVLPSECHGGPSSEATAGCHTERTGEPGLQQQGARDHVGPEPKRVQSWGAPAGVTAWGHPSASLLGQVRCIFSWTHDPNHLGEPLGAGTKLREGAGASAMQD